MPSFNHIHSIAKEKIPIAICYRDFNIFLPVSEIFTAAGLTTHD